MTNNPTQTSPQVYARITGILYLVVIVLGIFAEAFTTGKLVVPGDAATTAHNILNSPGLWNLGVGADLLVVIVAIPQLWLEYYLLKPVNKQLAQISLLFNLVSLAVESVSKLFLLLVMPILGSADYLKSFNPEQVHVLANLALRSHDLAFNVALVFFGFTCLLNGYLIAKSAYFPKFIGLLMQLAGLSYLIACFSQFFAPEFADIITPGILIPALIGESSFCLCLLVKGVNLVKWNEKISVLPHT